MERDESAPTTETQAQPVRAGKRPRRRSSSSSDLAPGTQVGRFVVIEKVGKGGMGVVYAARDPVLDRRVAIKLWRPSFASDDARARARERLLREAQALAQLSHPNIVAVHDFGEHGDGAFLAMELVAGRSLRQWIRDAVRTPAQVIEVLRAAGAGLAAAHKIGIIHRDFKPENVIVADDGRVRVLDFGLARAIAGSDSPPPGGSDDSPPTPAGGITADGTAPHHLASPLTQHGTVIGTPRYMAPEQHARGEADAQSDQYSFCVTAFQCLYGVHPFRAHHVAEMLGKIEAGEVTPVALRGVPRRWHRAIVRGLSHDRRDRYPSMDELLRALAWDPRAARRRALYGGVAVVLAGAAVIAWVRGPGRAQATCAGGDDRVAAVWNDGTRAQIGRALAASGVAHADALARRLDDELDGYARRWAVARTRACEDTRVRGVASEQVLDLRMRCLDGRLDELHNLAAIYTAAPDRAAATRALEVARSLGRLEGCDDVTALAAQVPPPGDPASRARVDAIEARLRTIKTLVEVGRHRDALELARAQVEPARAAAYPPVLAKVLFTVGRLESVNGDSTAGEARLREALAVAGGVPDDALFADILSELVYVTGYEAARYDEALAIATVLTPYLDRKTIDDDGRSAALSHLGVVRWAKGQLPEAAALFQRALELRERARGADDPSLSPILDNLGNVAVDMKRPAEALAYYQRSVALVTRAYGDDHPDVGRSLLNMGTVLSDQGRLDEAIAAFRRALAIFEAAYGDRHELIAAAADNLGETLAKAGRWDEALAACQRALAVGDATLEPDHPIHAYHLLCVVHAQLALGRAADAVPLAERAVRLREKGDPDLLAQAKDLLGRALWDVEAGRGRARTALAEARALYGSAKDEAALADLDAWIAKRSAR